VPKLKTRKVKVVSAILAFFVVFAVLGLRWDLEVRHFEFTSDKLPAATTITLVQISDFHSNNYGVRQNRVVEAVIRANPDAVLLSGDIIDRRLPWENAIELVEELTYRWPVFFSFGNHEFLSHRSGDFLDILETNGVTILRGETIEFHTQGAAIQIGGLDDIDVNWARPRDDNYFVQVEHLGAAINPELFSVVMSHRPERVFDILPFQPDLVLSGHAHGGQWAIPFILPQGLFAPGQGIFPTMTNGLFSFDQTQLIVSRGLSRYAPPVPRIFNRPDLIVITISGSNSANF
jgi:uncharacterized protein